MFYLLVKLEFINVFKITFSAGKVKCEPFAVSLGGPDDGDGNNVSHIFYVFSRRLYLCQQMCVPFGFRSL